MSERPIRSSAAEYLTYVASTGADKESVEIRYEDEDIWLTQRMMAALYQVDVKTVNSHIQTILKDRELREGATIRKYQIVQQEGTRMVHRDVNHYNLQMIITDIYATAVDYDKDAKATRRFYATVQNKMHYAVHSHTAAELIVERADHTKHHMGLTTWKDAPDGKIQKTDVVVAKNYLSADELGQLNRMVTAYLDYAENMAMRHIPLTMEDWEKRLNRFIEMFEYGMLKDAGKVSAEVARLHALTEFEQYRVIQDTEYVSDFDRFMLEQSDQ